MERKIIFFDIDGTLYSSAIGAITDKVKEAIRQTMKKGHLCFIASGRPYGYIAENVKELGFDGYVLANGANVKYDEKDLTVHALDYHKLKKMIDKLKSHSIEYVLQTTENCCISENYTYLLNFYKNCNIDFHNFCYNFDEDEVMHRTVKVEAWVKDEEELAYAKDCFQDFLYELHPDNHSMEIYSRDVSKATGILDVLKQFNIPLEDSYCFGDGPNDVEMFETVGHGIAMGNAIEIIKQKSDEICLGVEEDGVAYKLKELFDLDIK